MHACQQYLALGKVDDHTAVAVGAIALGHALKIGGVEDLPLLLVGRVETIRANEQILAEQVLPGGFGGHAYRQVVFRVGADVYLAYKAVFLGDVGFNAIPEGIKLVRVERAVDGAPMDIVRGAGLFDDVAVFRGPACTFTGFDHQGTICGQLAFASFQCQLNQLCCTQIIISVTHFDLALGM